MYKIVLGIVSGLLLFSGSAMATCSSYPNTLTNGQPADANQVMQNFNCAALTSGSLLSNITINGSNAFYVEKNAVGPDDRIAKFQSDPTTQAGYTEFILQRTNSAGETNSGGLIFTAPANGGGTNEAASIFAFTDSSTASSGHVKGALVFATNDGTQPFSNVAREYIAANGNVGIGTTSPSYTLHVNGSVAGVGAYNALSDVRHKKDIEPLQDGALERIMRLRPVSFFWKTPKDDGMKGRQMGFIAQEVEKVLPTTVLTENNAEKTKGLKYNEITAVLTKAVQEQEIEIRDLRMANDNRMSEVSQLQTELGVLKRQLKVQAAQN